MIKVWMWLKTYWGYLLLATVAAVAVLSKLFGGSRQGLARDVLVNEQKRSKAAKHTLKAQQHREKADVLQARADLIADEIREVERNAEADSAVVLRMDNAELLARAKLLKARHDRKKK